MKRQFWSVWVALLLFAGAWGGPIIEGGTTTFPWYLSRTEARLLAKHRHPPTFPAKAALIFSVTGHRALLEQNAHVPLPPASLTKLMTALVVREHLHLEQMVTVPPEARVGESSMGLRPGQQVHVETLLYGLLLNSGNDAAVTLAIAAAGDEETFVQWMNEKAQEMGLEHTHFVNPHGLDAVEHVSTAWDLARIAEEVLEDPVLAQIVRTKEIHIDGWHLVNRNRLLGERRDVVGVKTGTTLLAGQCLIAAFEDHGHTIIIVVLGAQHRYDVVMALWQYYRSVYTWQRLDLPEGRVREIHKGKTVRRFRLAYTPWVLLPTWQARHVTVTWELSEPTPTDKGWIWPNPAGVAHFFTGERALQDIPLTWEHATP